MGPSGGSVGGAPTLPPVGLTCTGPQEGAPEATCQIQAATSTPSVHRSAPRSPRQDHHRAPHDANSRLQTGGITTIGPRHADDTPPRASYGSNSPHRCIATKVARNFPRSFFKTARKRCNSNVLNSMFEILAEELRATLLGNHSGISHRRGRRRPEHQRRHRQSQTPGSTDVKGTGRPGSASMNGLTPNKSRT